MRLSLPLMVSPAMTIGLTAAAIVVILFAANFTITNAQQQTSQPAAIQNGTLFQNAEDGFRVQVPEGWVIHDMENTGFALFSEMLQGYGILAQLCSEEQQQQALRNVGSGTLSSCEGSEGDVIYIVRYPNVGARLGLASDGITTITNDTIHDILSYQIQKLQEVGYRDIQILNSTDTTVNVDISTEAGINDNTVPVATVPAKLVEITYSTNFAPNEIRTGQFILTATDATAHNLGTITGYSIFYEGAASAATAAGEETTTASGSLPSSPTTTAVRQVFDSFELITAEEVTQATAEPQTEQTQETDETNDDGDTTQDDGNDDNDSNSDSNADDCDGVSVGGTSAADDYDCTPDANNNNNNADSDDGNDDSGSNSDRDADNYSGEGDNDGA
jgi:hypothetical protein